MPDKYNEAKEGQESQEAKEYLYLVIPMEFKLGMEEDMKRMKESEKLVASMDWRS